MAPNVTVTVVQSEGTRAVVAVSGELDLDYAALLRQTCQDLVEAGRTDLVLDVSRLDFCDSAGLSAMLQARRLAVTHQGSFALAAPTGTVERILTVTGASTVITLYPTVREALDALG